MKEDTGVELLLDGLDESDLGSLLRTYDQVNQMKKQLTEKADMLKDKIKIALKERKWASYKDAESQISVSITVSPRESVNKETLKLLLNDEQYNQVVVKTSSERMSIINPKDRERLRRYANK
jgi:hypothetical protein